MMVMLTVAETEPCVPFAQIVYVVAVVWRTVGMPQIVPLLVPKLRPAGKVELIAHVVTVPETVVVAFNGRSLLAWSFVRVRSYLA